MIDNRNKRMSFLGPASPFPTVLPNPHGEIDGSDRLQLLKLYSGIVIALNLGWFGNMVTNTLSSEVTNMLSSEEIDRLSSEEAGKLSTEEGGKLTVSIRG